MEPGIREAIDLGQILERLGVWAFATGGTRLTSGFESQLLVRPSVWSSCQGDWFVFVRACALGSRGDLRTGDQLLDRPRV